MTAFLRYDSLEFSFFENRICSALVPPEFAFKFENQNISVTVDGSSHRAIVQLSQEKREAT